MDLLTQKIKLINENIDHYIKEYETDLMKIATKYVHKHSLYHIKALSDKMITEIIEELNIEKIEKDIHKIVNFNNLSNEDKESFLYYQQIYNYEEFDDYLNESIHYHLGDIIRDFEHILFDS